MTTSLPPLLESTVTLRDSNVPSQNSHFSVLDLFVLFMVSSYYLIYGDNTNLTRHQPAHSLDLPSIRRPPPDQIPRASPPFRLPRRQMSPPDRNFHGRIREVLVFHFLSRVFRIVIGIVRQALLDRLKGLATSSVYHGSATLNLPRPGTLCRALVPVLLNSLSLGITGSTRPPWSCRLPRPFSPRSGFSCRRR